MKNSTKNLAEELKEIYLAKKLELDKKQELTNLEKQKIEQERIDTVLKKTYDYFESNWLKEAQKAALNGSHYFYVRLVEEKYKEIYDIETDCVSITGEYLYNVIKIINKIGLDYFYVLCEQIKANGFVNVEVVCKEEVHTTINLNHYTIYTLHICGEF